MIFFHFLGYTYIVITSLDYTVSNREWWLSAVISAQFNNYWSPFDAIGYFLKCEGFVYSIVSEIFEMINMKEYWAKLFSGRNKLIIKLLNIEYLYIKYRISILSLPIILHNMLYYKNYFCLGINYFSMILVSEGEHLSC